MSGPSVFPFWLEVVSKVATPIAVLIALSPHIWKAFYLLTTEPRRTEDDREKQIALWNSARAGFIQRMWFSFLYWCRRRNDENLSWKERRARALWCPLFRHKFGKIDRPAKSVAARCTRCWAYLVAETEESLEAARRRGKVREMRLTRIRDEERL